jgi:hypothetical protein
MNIVDVVAMLAYYVRKSLAYKPGCDSVGLSTESWMFFFLMGLIDARDSQPIDNIPIPCTDAVAFCFMPNLIGRCTLNKLVSISASLHFFAKRTNSIFIKFFCQYVFIASFHFMM